MKSKNAKQNLICAGIVGATIASVPFIFKIGYDSMNHKIENQNPEPTITESIPTPNFESETPIPTCSFEPIEPYYVETENSNSKLGYSLSDEDRWYAEAIVAGEAGFEPMEGKMAVAQCLLNAMNQDGISIQEARTKYGYQGWYQNFGFDFPEDGEEVSMAVSNVFDNGETVTDENILWFYNRNNGYSGFHEGQKEIMTIGEHTFFAPWN